jgi:hypothetical protein
MQNPPVIGIAGPARAGKDSFARFLHIYLGGNIYSMADPIRSMLRGIGINMDDPYWRERKEEPIPLFNKSPRQLMQTLGTEWGRNIIHPNIWVLMAHRFHLEHPEAALIVPDIRFENEAKWIRNCKHGLVIHLEREQAPPVHPHSSEYGVTRAPQDLIVQNNGTLEDLQIAAREVFYAVAKARNSLYSADS